MLGGIAAVMVVVIAFSGRNRSKERVMPPIPNAVVDPNVERIHDFRKEVEERTRQLEIEQAELIGKQQARMSFEAEPSVRNPSTPTETLASIRRATHRPSERDWTPRKRSATTNRSSPLTSR